MSYDLEKIRQLNETLNIQKTFEIAHVGWECDSKGYEVIDVEGHHYVVLTNHGSPYFAEITELHNKRLEYSKLSAAMTNAIAWLDER